MSFFGAVFASLTLYWQWHLSGAVLALPFVGFVLIGLAASYVIRGPGEGIKPDTRSSQLIVFPAGDDRRPRRQSWGTRQRR